MVRHIATFIVMLVLACAACGGNDNAPSGVGVESTQPTETPGSPATDQGSPGPAGGELDGTEWALVQMGGEPPLPGTDVTLAFTSEMMSGYAGCNIIGSSYIAGPDGSLTFESIRRTEMFCENPPGIIEQETAYVETLAATASYDIADNTLTLRDASGATLLRFERNEPADATGDLPMRWQLTTIIEADMASSLLAGTEITLEFDTDILADGSARITGSAGCNGYNATARITGERLRVSPPVSTRMFCGTPEGVMDQENRFLMILADATTLIVDRDELRLAADDGRALLFQPVE